MGYVVPSIRASWELVGDQLKGQRAIVGYQRKELAIPEKKRTPILSAGMFMGVLFFYLNHKAHKEHKGKEKLFLVLFVCFVVPIQISQPVSIPMFTGLLSLSQCH